MFPFIDGLTFIDRRFVVPSSSAYGRAGVSRYDAFKMGLLNPVPRDEDLIYDIELLRCSTMEVSTGKKSGAAGDGDGNVKTQQVQACCIEDNYPCKEMGQFESQNK